MAKLEVGQVVVIGGEERTITKVGRKLAEFGHHSLKIDMETMETTSKILKEYGHFVQPVYASVADYEEAIARDCAAKRVEKAYRNISNFSRLNSVELNRLADIMEQLVKV